MLELIDRQMALAEIDDTIAGSLQRPEDVYIDKGLTMARTLIEKLPTIEAEPVRHGRWVDGISRGSYSIYCSYCGSHKETICSSEYCPACGAKMDAYIEDDDGSGIGQTFSPD